MKLDIKGLKKLIEQVMKEELLLEGGAGGHMRHPFDLDDVRTGPDLLRKFEEIGQQIKAGARPDTKIDGVNTSIKVVDGPNGKEFAMDRGSGKPDDVEGITVDKLQGRFGEGHGMVVAGKNVLNIFNDALPDIEPELKELGLLNDPSKFFNMEYVKGTTNVLAYDHDFLKIHGVNQFYNKKDRAGNIIRPGAERPIDPETKKEIKDPAVPASYNKEAMEVLVKKLNKYSGKYGFKIYSSIGSKAVGDFDFTPVLSVPAPITLSQGNIEQKSLGDRLKVAINRIGEVVKTVDGRKPPAQGKEIYKAVLGASATDKNADPSRQVPLDKLLLSKDDYQKAIDGAVFWHATRLFGNVIIENMEVDHPAVKGPAKDHEGLVIRLPGDDFDIKITGEFILGGEASSFRSDTPQQKTKRVGIFPGSFKPPHKGHLSVIKGVLQNPDIDEVKVIISAPAKEVRSAKITPEKAKEVFEKYIAAAKFSKPVSVEVASKPSPIGVAYEYIGEKAEPNETVVLLTSEADASRYPQSVLDKAVSMNKNASTIKAKSLVLPACRDEGCSTTEKVSATTIRNVIDAFPNVSVEDVKKATSLMPDEMSMADKLSIFELLIGEPLTNKFSKEEISNLKSLEEASVAGSVAGYAGGIGKKEEERTIYNMKETLSLEENILKDYLVERYVDKFKSLLKEVDSATATGMTYVTDAFSTTKSNFEKRFGGLGEQDQRISFLVNFLNKMVHGFIQQDVGEGIPPVMPFDELVEKGILTFDISKSAQEFAQSALEEGELNEQEGDEPTAPEGEETNAEEPAAPEAEGGEIEGLVPDEESDSEAAKEKEQQDKMKAGQISPEVTEEPLPNTNETGNRAALAYYKLDSKNIFRFYNLIGPEDTADREQFIEFYFKNVIALAAGIERSKSGNLPEPLNTMFNKLSTGSDVVKAPTLEEPVAAPAAAPVEAPAPAPLAEGDFSRIIKNSVIDTFKRLQYR
jgi:nicotinamide mononucleotide adenylyltransferase